MRQNRIYTKLAREEIEAGATAPGEEVVAAVPVEAGADSLEADLVEVNQDIVDIAQDEDSVDDAADVVEELEVAAESLRIIAGNGGLDRNGAIMLNLYTASLNKRVGLEANHKTLSVESFGGSNSRAGQTSLAAEAFADKAKELWGKIVEMFRSALKAVVAVWNRLFDGATKMKSRAEGIVANSKSLKSEMTNKTFENQKLAENLHINGTVDAKAAAKAVQSEASILSALAKHAIAFASEVSSVVESGDVAKLPELAKKAADLPASNFTKVADAATVGLAAVEGMEILKSEALPGNKTLVAFVPGADAKADTIGKTSMKLGTFDASKKVGDKVQLATLSATDIGLAAQQIAAAADLVIAYKPVQKEAEQAANKVIALAEKKAKETAKAGAEGMVDKAKAQFSGSDERAIAKGAMSLVTNVAPPLAAFTLNAGGYVLQYCEQSIKQYNAKAAEQKKPEAPAAAAA